MTPVLTAWRPLILAMTTLPGPCPLPPGLGCRYAREHEPCIIFMDEIDAIGGKRFSEGTSADREVGKGQGRPVVPSAAACHPCIRPPCLLPILLPLPLLCLCPPPCLCSSTLLPAPCAAGPAHADGAAVPAGWVREAGQGACSTAAAAAAAGPHSTAQQQACRFLSVMLLSCRMLSPAQLTSARSTQLLTEGIARPPDPTPACLSACLLACR